MGVARLSIDLVLDHLIIFADVAVDGILCLLLEI